MTEAPTRHIVLCGLDTLGFGTLEELRRVGEEVVVVAHGANPNFVEAARRLGATVIEGNYREEAVLRGAGVEVAVALISAESDDVGNLHAALAAQELNPRLRIVLRIFNQEFGRRIQSLLRDCSALSASALAAPAFVAAALHHDGQPRIEVAGRLLVPRRVGGRDSNVLLPLARFEADGTTRLFPEAGDDVLSLMDGGPAAAATAPGRSPPRLGRLLRGLSALVTGSDRRLHWLLAILLLLGLASVGVFQVFAGLELIDAVYFTVTIITTTGFGDINLRDAPPGLKLYAVALMLFGAATLAIFYALITDLIVGARLTRLLGGVPRGLRDHIVVCGLGNTGTRIVEQLGATGTPVVAAELEENGRFVSLVRRLGVPVLASDAKLIETLDALQVRRARCLIAVTNDDLANLEAALNARSLNPGLRVVLRLFDTDLAARVERAFDIHISRSVSALAAPAFAAAAMGRRVLATLPVGSAVLIVAQAEVQPASAAAGRTIDELERGLEGRVLALESGGRLRWRPAAEVSLAPGDGLIVVATRQALAQLFERTEAPRASTVGLRTL